MCLKRWSLASFHMVPSNGAKDGTDKTSGGCGAFLKWDLTDIYGGRAFGLESHKVGA